MLKRLLLLFAAAVVMLPLTASAQTLNTVRDINAIPQANLDVLAAGGANLQAGDIPALIFNDLVGSEVTFQAVVMSDPFTSGLGNPPNPGEFPSRVHVFVRDINASTLGVEGMGIQLVDGNAQTSGIMDVTVGDVVQIIGTFAPFGTTMQIAPISVELLGSLEDFGLSEDFMDPVVISTGDANGNIADGQYQANWSNFANLRGQYVRIEGATIQRRNIANTRLDWLFTSDNGETILNVYDTSIRYRNDQRDYPSTFNFSDDDFLPPPPGSRINIEGFLTFNGDDPFTVSVPAGSIFSINPFEDDDLEITEAPPIVTPPSRPDFVPTTDAVTITSDVTVDPTRTLTSAVLKYTTSSDATEQMVTMANTSGDTYSAEIPAQADGDFVTYWVEATDSQGAVSTSDPASLRFLVNGITSISHVQLTADEGVGSSPFAGITTGMNITATVQSDPATSGLYVIQDNADLMGWSGVFLSFSGTAPTLNRGDVINITEGAITESFGVTQINDPVMTVTSTGGASLGYKTVTTDVLQNAGLAEAHEGMMLRFENVTITSIDRFGEWSFSSDGTADNAVSADDASAALSSSFNSDTFVEGATVGSMQGVWWYSFGSFKLVPESPDDVNSVEVPFTVRDINTIPQANLDVLAAGGANLQAGDIPALIFNDLVGSEVTFQAVVMSDPFTSGLGNPPNPGEFPSRVHVFVRDINASTLGVEGMGIQLVDGNAQTSGIMDVTVGDVVQIIGTFAPFGTTMQIAPISVELLGSLEDFGLSEDFMDPVVISTGDANGNIADGQYQANWSNFANLRGQYVRIEGATIQRRNIANTRLDWLFTSDNGETILNVYDTSIRYRNDQRDYPSTFNFSDDDFLPPPPGSRINIEGFLTFNGDDPFTVSVPAGSIFSINPFEDDDLEITEAPPIVTPPSRPDFVPTTDAVTITSDVTVDPTRTLTSAVLKYTTSSDATEQMVTMANTSGDTYSAEIPAQADGDFVTYWVEATDSQGAVSTSDPASLRFLVDGINEISDIQLTADEGVGSSPFASVTTAMNITATVQSDPATSGLYVIQDNADLMGWSGVFLSFSGTAPTLNRGDVINITEGAITESFGVTQINDPVMTVTSTGGASLGYKTVTTDVLQNAGLAEAHEGMMLRFENVTITSIDRFGEWSFSSDGTADNAVSADDASAALSSSFNSDTFVEGATVGSMQGVWWYSFGSFKLVPESPDDVTDVNAVSIEEVEGTLPTSFGLHQNYPNPFNPVTTIAYDVPSNAQVTIRVYDLMGREVTTLVDAPHNAGKFRVAFDAQDLASGMYIYRLTAGTKILTQTMVLLK